MDAQDAQCIFESNLLIAVELAQLTGMLQRDGLDNGIVGTQLQALQQ